MNKISALNDLSNKIIEAIPEIVYLGDPILRTETKRVSVEEGVATGNRLFDILKRYRDLTGIGRGLASPQIGISQSVFVTFVDDVFKVYINPEITSVSESTNIYRENCLSSCHIWCDVVRPESIEIKYINETGAELTEKYSGFMARLLQHEYDHLRGLVNIDKAKAGTIDYKTGDPLKEVLRANV
jgi:peptide deformylase